MSGKDVKCLSAVSKEEQRNFINSIDIVLCDCDGVLWEYCGAPIQGVDGVLEKMEAMKKRIYFVTNNTLLTLSDIAHQLKGSRFNLKEELIITPVTTTINYLKSINFNKKILAVVTNHFKAALKEAGYEVVEPNPKVEVNDASVVLIRSIEKDVGAVILDIDFNFNVMQMNDCVQYLSDPNVLFLAGCNEKLYQMRKNLQFIGPGYTQEMISVAANRQPLVLAKPGLGMKNVVNTVCKIEDPKRVLFIGDSLSQDIMFGSLCGFKKLLTLSGVTDIETLQNCDNPDCIPNYYVNQVPDLEPLLDEILNN